VGELLGPGKRNPSVKGETENAKERLERVEQRRLRAYRPISLVGCVYKILTKLLANRFKKVIGKVVDGTQSTFFCLIEDY